MNYLQGDKESGQVILIMTLGIILLLGVAALVIDGGMYFVNRRNAQNAADSAALAGVLAKYNGEDCETKAIERAASNGFEENDDVDVTVDCNYGDDGNYVHVTISSANSTLLSGLIGREQTTNQVEAEAYYNSGDIIVSTYYTNGAIMALKPSESDTFWLNGNAYLNVEGGGVFVNSTDSSAFSASGSQVISTGTGINIVGGASLGGKATINSNITAGKTVSIGGNATVNGKVLENQSVNAISYPPGELIIGAPVVTQPTCSGTGTLSTSGNTITLTPGNHSTQSFSGNYSITFMPGNYCFSGDLSFSDSVSVTADSTNFSMGSNDITFSDDTVFHAANSLFYLESGGFNLEGNSSIDIPNTTVYMESGGFALNGNDAPSIVSDETSVIYLGSGNIHFNGNSTFTSTNTAYYLKNGAFTWNGKTVLVMDAPDDGTYAGLLIYLPYKNTSTLTINGNSGNSLTGSIIAPGANLIINGNSDTTTFNSRIIGYTFNFIGSTTMHVIYNADDNYDIGNGNPYIEFIK